MISMDEIRQRQLWHLYTDYFLKPKRDKAKLFFICGLALHVLSTEHPNTHVHLHFFPMICMHTCRKMLFFVVFAYRHPHMGLRLFCQCLSGALWVGFPGDLLLVFPRKDCNFSQSLHNAIPLLSFLSLCHTLIDCLLPTMSQPVSVYTPHHGC